MKKITFALATVAAVLSGCSKETQTLNDNVELSEGPLTITASMDDVTTKVVMTDNGTSVSYAWKASDRILFVNPGDVSDSVYYKISSGAGTTSATFTKSSGDFNVGNTYVCCHIGNGVRLNASGEFTDKDGKPIFKGQNPVHIENYMVFAGFNGSPKAYSFSGASIPSFLGFEAPFTMLKVGVNNTSSASVEPNGIKVDGGQGSSYFLGTLKVDATSGVAASDPVDYLQTGIWDGSGIETGTEEAYSFICVQNPSRSFNGLKVSIFY